MRALCLGSAACVDEDVAAAEAMGVKIDDTWTIIACNRAGVAWQGRLDHWVTFHAENFAKWISARHAARLPPAGEIWVAERRSVPKGFTTSRAPNWGGSSGLLTATVALTLGATHVVLCGVPLDYKMGHAYSPKVPWSDGVNYRHAWVAHQKEMANVRSMSGWTMELLGAPTPEWIAEGDVVIQSRAPEGES